MGWGSSAPRALSSARSVLSGQCLLAFPVLFTLGSSKPDFLSLLILNPKFQFVQFLLKTYQESSGPYCGLRVHNCVLLLNASFLFYLRPLYVGMEAKGTCYMSILHLSSGSYS